MEKIVPIEWNISFEVGHPLIDSDHEELFKNVNEFMAAVRCNAGQGATKKALHRARSYAEYHFEHEEQIMMRERYNGLGAHKILHADFISAISTYSDRFIQSHVDANDFLFYLRNWIENHILVYDRQFGVFLKNNRAK